MYLDVLYLFGLKTEFQSKITFLVGLAIIQRFVGGLS